MQSLFLTHKSSSIHYRRSANNSVTVLLCFHGYGESAAAFDFLEKYMGDAFTIIAIDLPFHGKTEWKEGLNFSMDDLLAISKQIIFNSSTPSSKIIVTGFSMGGRIALALLQAMPQQIEKIVLLAPDGLTTNGWYWLSTQSKPGNVLFRLAMQTPGLLPFLLGSAKALHIINRGLYTFIDHFIHTSAKRMEVYIRWTALRKIKPNLPLIKSLIRDHQIQTRLLYGRYDQMISFKKGEKFKAGIEAYTKLEVIDTGHLVLLEKNIAVLVDLFKN